MKIEKIKINSFGKLENKEYNLSENINLIYGKNEAGKSTLLKFIQNTFYGTSKNKKGKTFSDYDLYKPWNDGDFSGKIKYKLDSGEEYEVYREFGKKSPKIYNNKLEDISKKFNIDKTTGNEFFFEQTKVDEFTFLTSIVSMQQEVKLNKQDQNVYIQKIANLAGTGDDGVSYKKAIDKLNKKQLDEIGTDRSSGKPINISISKINKYEEEIKELEIYKEKQYNIEKEINDLKKEIEKEKNKHFRFTLTTNGVLLTDDVIDFLNKEMNNVVLSLDGRKEINDAKRKKLNGEGSYDIIVPHFKNFVEKRGNKEYYMRGTFTRNNLDFTNDIFHMADLGFKELSMEPVVSKPDTDYALREEDLDTLFEQYEILAKEMIKRKREGNPFTFYHYMIDLSGGPCIYKRITGCGSGTEYLAVTPNGDFYPCHQFVGDKKFLMGNVWDGVTNTELRDEFKLCNVYSRKECENCWAKLYCSGGCAANSYHTQGSINGVYEYGWKLFRKRIECAIMVKIAEAMDEAEAKEKKA